MNRRKFLFAMAAATALAAMPYMANEGKWELVVDYDSRSPLLMRTLVKHERFQCPRDMMIKRAWKNGEFLKVEYYEYIDMTKAVKQRTSIIILAGQWEVQVLDAFHYTLATITPTSKSLMTMEAYVASERLSRNLSL